MSEIAHALGYLSGAVGIGFAAGFGLFAGIKAATAVFGPIQIGSTSTIHHKYESTEPL